MQNYQDRAPLTFREKMGVVIFAIAAGLILVGTILVIVGSFWCIALYVMAVLCAIFGAVIYEI